MAEMAMCEIFRIFGIPRLTNIAGGSQARRFNQDAVAEIAGNMMQVFFTRPAVCPYVGSLDEGITFSLHGLLMGDDLAGQLRSMWRGIEVTDEMLALELTRAEGPRGNYLANQHTSKYCRRESWNTRFFGAHVPTSSGGLTDEDLIERIERELQDILLNHHPEALAPEILREMRSITDRFRQNHVASS
jgi:trimethylamine--corrinoid protein Co-methyltransferase